jgi:hypothetical protein
MDRPSFAIASGYFAGDNPDVNPSIGSKPRSPLIETTTNDLSGEITSIGKYFYPFQRDYRLGTRVCRILLPFAIPYFDSMDEDDCTLARLSTGPCPTLCGSFRPEHPLAET